MESEPEYPLPSDKKISSDLAKWILDSDLPSFMALLASVRRPDGSRLDAEEYLSVGPKLIDVSESCKMTLEAMLKELELTATFAVSTADLKDETERKRDILLKFFPFEGEEDIPDGYKLYGLIYRCKRDGRLGASTLTNGKWTSIGSGYFDDGKKTEVEPVVEAWGCSSSLEKFEGKKIHGYSLDRDEIVDCYTWDDDKQEMTKSPVKRPFLILRHDEMPYNYDEVTNPFPKFPTKHIGRKVLMVKLYPDGKKGPFSRTAPSLLMWGPSRREGVFRPRLVYIDDCFVDQTNYRTCMTQFWLPSSLPEKVGFGQTTLVSVADHQIESEITMSQTIVTEETKSLVFMNVHPLTASEKRLLGAVLFGFMSDNKITYTGCPELIGFVFEELDPNGCRVLEYLTKLGNEKFGVNNFAIEWRLREGNAAWGCISQESIDAFKQIVKRMEETKEKRSNLVCDFRITGVHQRG